MRERLAPVGLLVAAVLLVSCGSPESSAARTRAAVNRLTSPIDRAFDATLRVESSNGVTETWSIHFASQSDWSMSVADASAPKPTPGQSSAAAEPIGFTKMVRNGRFVITEPGVVDLTQLGFSPDELVALQAKLGDKSPAVVQSLVDTGVLKRADRTALDKPLDSDGPILPDLMFDLGALRSKGVARDNGEAFVISTVGSGIPYRTVIYGYDGTPRSAVSLAADGTQLSRLTVLAFTLR